MKLLPLLAAPLLLVGCVSTGGAPSSDRVDLSCLDGAAATAIAVTNSSRDQNDRRRPCV